MNITPITNGREGGDTFHVELTIHPHTAIKRTDGHAHIVATADELDHLATQLLDAAAVCRVTQEAEPCSIEHAREAIARARKVLDAIAV